MASLRILLNIIAMTIVILINAIFFTISALCMIKRDIIGKNLKDDIFNTVSKLIMIYHA